MWRAGSPRRLRRGVLDDFVVISRLVSGLCDVTDDFVVMAHLVSPRNDEVVGRAQMQ